MSEIKKSTSFSEAEGKTNNLTFQHVWTQLEAMQSAF